MAFAVLGVGTEAAWGMDGWCGLGCGLALELPLRLRRRGKGNMDC